MKKQLLSFLTCFLIITSIFFMSLPVSTGEKVTKENIITVKKIDDEDLVFEADEGVINYTWKILDNLNELRVDFTISYKNDLMVLRLNVTKDSSKIKVDKDKEGKYTFKWLNNNQINITISFKISYEKDEIKEGTGCYSAAIALAMIFIAIIIWVISFGFIKK